MLFNARAALPAANRGLLNAADYIRDNGWCQGAYQKGRAVCVMAAILKVCGQNKNDAMDAARLVLDEVANVSGAGIGIGYWNDNICRSEEQAITTLETIAWRTWSGN